MRDILSTRCYIGAHEKLSTYLIIVQSKGTFVQKVSLFLSLCHKIFIMGTTSEIMRFKSLAKSSYLIKTMKLMSVIVK